MADTPARYPTRKRARISYHEEPESDKESKSDVETSEDGWFDSDYECVVTKVSCANLIQTQPSILTKHRNRRRRYLRKTTSHWRRKTYFLSSPSQQNSATQSTNSCSNSPNPRKESILGKAQPTIVASSSAAIHQNHDSSLHTTTDEEFPPYRHPSSQLS